MKTLVLIFFLTSLSVSGFSQKLKASAVPEKVQNGFKKVYANTSAKWEREDKNYEANFEVKGDNISCVLNSNGDILETESVIKYNDLPAAIKTYVTRHYKNVHVKEAEKIQKASGEINYELSVKGKELVFDKNGNIISNNKEKKESD